MSFHQCTVLHQLISRFCALVPALMLALGTVAGAATITVDTTADDESNNDNCTLREAILAAKTDNIVDGCIAGNGSDTIDLTARNGIIDLAMELPDLRDNIEINGPGAALLTVRRGTSGQYRIFTVNPGATVTIRGMTLANGFTSQDLEFGGGIYNEGTLTLIDVDLVDGTSWRGGGIYNDFGTVEITGGTIKNNIANNLRGGGVYNNGGEVTITDSAITNNVASQWGGGIYNREGASLTLARVVISGNRTDPGDTRGGGIYNAGAAIITDTAITNNRSERRGGGIYNNGTLNVMGSTLGENFALKNGGGLYNYELGVAKLVDSTIISNSVTSGVGGGIVNFGSSTTGGILELRNSTVSDNVAGNTGSGIQGGGELTLVNSTVSGNTGGFSIDGGGQWMLINSTVRGNSGGVSSQGITIANTILATNGSHNCSGNAVISNGHNLDSDGTCNLTEATDLSNTDPLLGPLNDNGGPTLTHALLPGSPAIDAADNTVCMAAPVNGLDQRGMPRGFDGNSLPDDPQPGDCDIGSYEYQGLPTTIFKDSFEGNQQEASSIVSGP